MVPTCLFAKISRMDAMRRAFDGSRGYFSDGDINLVIALTCVLAGVLILFMVARLVWKSAWLRENPYLLFLELCWAHRVSIRDTLLLLQLAKQRNMANPAFVFLDPDAFTQASPNESLAVRIEGLYHRLF